MPSIAQLSMAPTEMLAPENHFPMLMMEKVGMMSILLLLSIIVDLVNGWREETRDDFKVVILSI